MKLKTLFFSSLTLTLLLGSACGALAQSPPPVSFSAPLLYQTGLYPGGIAVADFNGDGKLDLAVVNNGNDTVSIFLGNGDGTFQNPASYTVGYYPVGIAVGDFRSNGKLDLAVANCSSSLNPAVSVLLGNGDGSFEPATNYTVGNGPCGVAVGDFNGDGKPDLVVADYFANNVSVLIGNGDGTFQPAKYVSTGNYSPEWVTVGDFNKDGKLDFAVAAPALGGVQVFLGNGDGTFTGLPYIATPTGSYSLTTASLRNNGTLDLVTTGTSAVNVLLGNGDGTFQTVTSYSVGVKSCFVAGAAVGDFNRDGKLDLATANNDGSTLSVLLGNGDGTFQTQAVNWWVGNYGNLIAAGDFNGDGWSDLTVTFGTSGSYGIVLLNAVPTPMQPESPDNLSQQFVFNPTPTAYLAFDLDYTTAYNAGTLNVVADTVAMASASGITQAIYQEMVAGTSLATTNCYIALGQGTDSSGNPLCAAITLTCTNESNSTPAGDNCPTSTARNLFWANQLETTSPIGGSSTYPTGIPAGAAPTLAMGSDTWSPGNCTLTGPEKGRLCPQSLLTRFTQYSTDSGLKPGGTNPGSNSTYVAGCCEPEWNTVATVPVWYNNKTVPVSFTTSPPTGSYSNNWVAAPNQGITWGVEALGATPDPTYPVLGDQTVTNAACPPPPWPLPGTTPLSFTATGTVTVTADGLYEVHYFSTACDNQEELVFTSSTDPTQNWAAFKTAPFNVDLTKPTVSTPVLSPSPVNGAYLPGQLGVTATVTCVDPVSNGVASGLVQCGKDSVSPSPAPPATSQASFTSSANPVTIPTTVGPQTFTLTATDQAGNQGTGSVTYQVVGPLASVSTSSIDFGTVYLGTITTRSVTVTNVGNAPMTISTPFISILSGGNSKEYFAVSLCPKSLAVEKSCTIYVNFIAGPFYTPQTAMLYVADNAYGSPQTVALSAQVINPQAWLTPTSLSFGTVGVGNNSTTKTVTLKNTGATPLAINSIGIAGTDFAQTNTCLPLIGSGVLGPGASCTITFTFTPQAKGSRSASVMITDNAQNSPQKISLSGTGG